MFVGEPLEVLSLHLSPDGHGPNAIAGYDSVSAFFGTAESPTLWRLYSNGFLLPLAEKEVCDRKGVINFTRVEINPNIEMVKRFPFQSRRLKPGEKIEVSARVSVWMLMVEFQIAMDVNGTSHSVEVMKYDDVLGQLYFTGMRHKGAREQLWTNPKRSALPFLASRQEEPSALRL